MNTYYSRAGRKKMIVMAFLVSMQQRQGHEMTSYRIARKVGMAASGHLRDILSEMVRDGELCARQIKKAGRFAGYVYSLPSGSYVDPHDKKNRKVAIKVKGKPVDQLELF